MKIGGKLCSFIVLYPSPSQYQDDFETFLKNFELNFDLILADNPFLTVVLDDFNVISNLWCKSDKTHQTSKIEGITSQLGLQQLINDPTHLTRNSSSCIDFLFALQPNLVVESGVHSLLHKFCHQSIYGKFNLEIFHYQKPNTENISKAIRSISMGNGFYKYRC